MANAEQTLRELGIELPPLRIPTASYVPYTRSGNLLFVSGQICQLAGAVKFQGLVGRDLTVEEGRDAAELCGLNLLTVAREACGGDLDKIAKCLRLTGYVLAPSGFVDAPKVINGASDLMLKVFGEAGKHARTAIAVAGLPGNAAVEVEGIFELLE